VVPFNVRLIVHRILAEFREGSLAAEDAIERLIDALVKGGDATTPPPSGT